MKKGKTLKTVVTIIAVISMGLSIVHADVNIENDLIAYFPFEGNSSDVHDSHSVEEIGSITYIDGQVGKAAHFDGESYIEVPGEDFALTEWTFSLWFYVDKAPSTNASIIIGKQSYPFEGTSGDYNYATKYVYCDYAHQSYESCGGNNSDHNLASSPLNGGMGTGKWFHWVCTRSNDGIYTLYQNGKKKSWTNPDTVWGGGSAQDIPCIDHPETPFLIGGKITSSTHNFEGAIDELRVYGRALSSEEVTALYEDDEVYTEPEPCNHQAWLDDQVEFFNLAYAPSGAIHAYPNVIRPRPRKGRNVVLEGYIVSPLSALRYDTKDVIADTYIMVNDERHDIELDGTGFEVEINAPAKPHTELTVELYAEDILGNMFMIDSTKIKVQKHKRYKKIRKYFKVRGKKK